jgi:hypothetical protein
VTFSRLIPARLPVDSLDLSEAAYGPDVRRGDSPPVQPTDVTTTVASEEGQNADTYRTKPSGNTSYG